MFRLDLFVLSFALLATCLTGGLDAGHMEIIDSEDVDISHIAAVVCQDKMGFYKKISSHLTTVDKQISRFSTIDKLVSYLKKQDNLCEGSYLESLVELQDVIATGNADVCGERKIQAIEDYYRHYVNDVSKDRKLKKAIPKIIRLFFMHYATLISSMCQQSTHQLFFETLDYPKPQREITNRLVAELERQQSTEFRDNSFAEVNQFNSENMKQEYKMIDKPEKFEGKKDKKGKKGKKVLLKLAEALASKLSSGKKHHKPKLGSGMEGLEEVVDEVGDEMEEELGIDDGGEDAYEADEED